MPPIVKITKEDILEAAIGIVRQDGMGAVNARAIASALHCSTQPIFSNYASMQTLYAAIMNKAYHICNQYLQDEMQKGDFPVYKANGMAYIRFAKEEKELFKLLYMRDRAGSLAGEETELFGQMESIVRQNTGLGENSSRLFHLEMWAYVHGIAAMFATGYLELDWDLVSKMLTDAYEGMKKQYGME